MPFAALPAAVRNLVACLVCTAVFTTASAAEPTAHALYRQGQAAESSGDADPAYRAYRKALDLEPANLRYKVAFARSRALAASDHVRRGERLQEVNQPKDAVVEFVRALEIDPSNQLAQQDLLRVEAQMDSRIRREDVPSQSESQRVIEKIRRPVSLKELPSQPLTLSMQEDAKTIYVTVGKLAGLNVLFDPDYNAKRVSVQLNQVALPDALDIVATLSNTFWRPVTPNTIFVAQNSRAKRTELDQQGLQTFYLANVAQNNDLNDVQTALRNVLPNTKLYAVPSQNAVVMRGTPDELLLAQKLIDDLDKAKAEVIVDVAILEVSRDKLKNLGIQPPQSATVNLQADSSSSSSTSTSTSTSNLTLNTLSHLKGSNFAVTVGQAQAEALLTDSDSRVLQNPQVRATDGQQAILKIGSRIPIATGSYSTGVSTGTASAGVQTQFQYIDVGVNVDIKPVIHSDRDVTLKIKMEVSAHNGDSTISGVTEPIISQRSLEQTIRLKEGEANIVGGLLERDESVNVSGTPGLGSIPGLKYLFSTQKREVSNDEIVFLLIPHVVRAVQLNPVNLRQLDSGSGTSISTHLDDTNGQQSKAGADTDSGASHAAANTTPAAPSFQLVPSAITEGERRNLQLSVRMTNAVDIWSLPLSLSYDRAKLRLLSVDGGELLSSDGQSPALAHHEDDSGNVLVNMVRPKGASGVTGSGTLCVVSFEATAPGDTLVRAFRSIGLNGRRQDVQVAAGEATVHVP